MTEENTPARQIPCDTTFAVGSPIIAAAVRDAQIALGFCRVTCHVAVADASHAETVTGSVFRCAFTLRSIGVQMLTFAVGKENIRKASFSDVRSICARGRIAGGALHWMAQVEQNLKSDTPPECNGLLLQVIVGDKQAIDDYCLRSPIAPVYSDRIINDPRHAEQDWDAWCAMHPAERSIGPELRNDTSVQQREAGKEAVKTLTQQADVS